MCNCNLRYGEKKGIKQPLAYQKKLVSIKQLSLRHQRGTMETTAGRCKGD